MEADDNDPEWVARVAKAKIVHAQTQVARPPLDAARNIEFLVGSDALEGVSATKYLQGSNYAMGVGHAGALLDAQALGASQRALSGDDLLMWLEWITFEQDGRSLDRRERREAFATYAREIAAVLAERIKSREIVPFFMATFLADSMIAFRRLAHGMPHAGQIERLIANYIGAYLREPVLVFRADEGALYASASVTSWALRVDLSRKLREIVFWPGFGVRKRTRTEGGVDWYDGMKMDYRDWEREIERWRAADLEARGARGAGQTGRSDRRGEP